MPQHPGRQPQQMTRRLRVVGAAAKENVHGDDGEDDVGASFIAAPQQETVATNGVGSKKEEKPFKGSGRQEIETPNFIDNIYNFQWNLITHSNFL